MTGTFNGVIEYSCLDGWFVGKNHYFAESNTEGSRKDEKHWRFWKIVTMISTLVFQLRLNGGLKQYFPLIQHSINRFIKIHFDIVLRTKSNNLFVHCAAAHWKQARKECTLHLWKPKWLNRAATEFQWEMRQHCQYWRRCFHQWNAFNRNLLSG